MTFPSGSREDVRQAPGSSAGPEWSCTIKQAFSEGGAWLVRSYAEVAFTWHHLVSYWARTFPNHFEGVQSRAPSRFLLSSP